MEKISYFILIDINRHKNLFFLSFNLFCFIILIIYNLNMLSKAILASVLFMGDGSGKRPLYSPNENPKLSPYISEDRPEL